MVYRWKQIHYLHDQLLHFCGWNPSTSLVTVRYDVSAHLYVTHIRTLKQCHWHPGEGGIMLQSSGAQGVRHRIRSSAEGEAERRPWKWLRTTSKVLQNHVNPFKKSSSTTVSYYRWWIENHILKIPSSLRDGQSTGDRMLKETLREPVVLPFTKWKDVRLYLPELPVFARKKVVATMVFGAVVSYIAWSVYVCFYTVFICFYAMAAALWSLLCWGFLLLLRICQSRLRCRSRRDGMSGADDVCSS